MPRSPDVILRIRSAVAGAPGTSQWSVWTDIPPDLPTPFSQWVTHIQQGTRARENIQAAIDLSRLMEAANRSAWMRSHRAVGETGVRRGGRKGLQGAC